MCVTLGPADLGKTKIYMGEATHPQHGDVHVLGYQNQPVDQQTSVQGGNAMLLHVPAEEPLTGENLIDMGDDKWLETLCEVMDRRNFEPARRGGARSFSPPPVMVIQHGIYHVVLASVPTLIPSALEQVPVEKRPVLNQAIFEWYAQHLPRANVVLACFNKRDVIRDIQNRETAPPIWLWYRPHDPRWLTAPGIDAHDGNPPDLYTQVKVDSSIVIGTRQGHPRIGIGFERVRETKAVPPAFESFVPGRLRAGDFRGPYQNGDYRIDLTQVGEEISTSDLLTRGFPVGYVG